MNADEQKEAFVKAMMAINTANLKEWLLANSAQDQITKVQDILTANMPEEMRSAYVEAVTEVVSFDIDEAIAAI